MIRRWLTCTMVACLCCRIWFSRAVWTAVVGSNSPSDQLKVLWSPPCPAWTRSSEQSCRFCRWAWPCRRFARSRRLWRPRLLSCSEPWKWIEILGQSVLENIIWKKGYLYLESIELFCNISRGIHDRMEKGQLMVLLGGWELEKIVTNMMYNSL